ncbi:hypothetical protein LOZ58_005926 [Ophidiomyces ophidiicola]|nr:hypothetical protein LOZ58_005926 [Ophidiomyces ophidiicola]
MEAPFTEGVVYISREEEENAKARVLERNRRLASLDDIRLTDLDSQYTIFLQEARRLLDGFVNKVDTSFYVNIPGPELRSATPITITNFHKRLVHQLVRSEYPGLVSIGKSNFVHVIRYNQKREDKILEERLIHVRERIYSQTGFRWVVEAMIGGDLSKLPPRSFLSPDCEHSGSGQNVIAYSDHLQEKLKAKKLVMVGHNLFTDLVNFYSCFFGNLPDTVDEFLSIIHGLFPTVVDTKYLATFDCGSDLPSSTLEEIDEMFATKEMPVITIDPKYTKYMGCKVPHEAGYDSLVTARVFLRLVAHINTQEADALSKDSYLNENQSINETRLHSSIMRPSPAKYADKLMLSPVAEEIKRKKSEPVSVSKLAFAHRTIYDTLDQLNDDGSDSSFCGSSFENSTTFTTSGGDPMIEFKIEKGELLPRLDNEFWKIYGNKLRVFGTAERFCELTA